MAITAVADVVLSPVTTAVVVASKFMSALKH